MTKPKDDSVSKNIRREWENRLAFIDGAVAEDNDEEDDLLEDDLQELAKEAVADNPALVDAMGRAIKRRKRKKRKKAPKPVDDLAPSSTFAQRRAEGKAAKHLDKEICAVKRRVAIRLSIDARKIMERPKGPMVGDLDLVEALLCKSTQLLQEASCPDDAASQKVLIASWLLDNATPDTLPRALRLAESAQRVLGPQKRLTELKRDIRLRMEQEAQAEKDV